MREIKFGRTYKIIVEADSGEEIVINPSRAKDGALRALKVSFVVSRSTMSSLNTMQLKIYNLSKDTRDKIFVDRFNPKSYRKVFFSAGYEGVTGIATIFKGNIFQAYSYREGVDIVTHIEGRDGAFDTVNIKSSKTLKAGATLEEALRSLASDFVHINLGKVGETKGTFRRPLVLEGNTYNLIKKYTQGGVFIDFETLNIQKDNEVTDGQIPLINSETGLLGTPKRADSYLTIDTIFEPRVEMGQIIEVNSTVAPIYDGQYKVIGVNHSGVISESEGGQCVSTFSLLVGSQLFGGFKKVA